METLEPIGPMPEPDPRIPLYHIHGFPVRRCVQSGFCCKRAPCAFGEWDAEAHQCRHLQAVQEGADFTRYACGIYDQITALPIEQHAMNPAFGAGCCSPLFNTNRQAIIRHVVATLDDVPLP